MGKGRFCGILQALWHLERDSTRGGIAKMPTWPGLWRKRHKTIELADAIFGGMKHNSPTRCALRRLHAEIGCKIIDSWKNTKHLREDKRHVAAVIRMFSPDYDVKAIAARRTYKANPWFKRGTLFRSALDVMRKTTKPVRQIVDRMLAAKGTAALGSIRYAACNVPSWLPCGIARGRAASRRLARTRPQGGG
jgi:hypothetical protein